jgi:GNAT superfamily N-acetyltransferase
MPNESEIVVRDFQPTDIVYLTDLTSELGYETQLNSYWTFVAVLNEAIIGYIGVVKNYFWEQDGCFLRIQVLVVNKEYRGTGTGQKLINTTEQLAKQIGARVIVLSCANREERQAAHRFYSKMGFEARSTGYVKKIK